jgi:hypothetical protein
MDSKVNLDSPQTPFFKPACGFRKFGFLDHLIVGQAIAGRAEILQLPGNSTMIVRALRAPTSCLRISENRR